MKTNFNSDWQFRDGNDWIAVTLPHTPKIEAYDVGMHFQGESHYRKTFHIAPDDLGKRIVIEFEAIMQYCEIRVNGVERARHFGGYLPVYVDITDIAQEDNTVEVLADNRDMKDVPPGKPLEVLDFCYFGGIYRNAWLHITDQTYITLPVQKGKVAGGGIFVTYPHVSTEQAAVHVLVNAENGHETDDTVSVQITLRRGEDCIASVSSEPVVLSAGEDADFSFDLTVQKPLLWCPEHPHLYDLEVKLYRGTCCLEHKTVPIGIRSVAVRNGQFLLNGKSVKLYGTNRHQAFPYVGNAASDEAHDRDACLLKEMGINFVRLAHYPQSEGFLSACDALGIMLVEPIPGWQWFENSEPFRRRVLENAHDMVLRDRNHPSIIFWESTLNESHNMPNDFCREIVEAIKAEYPTDQCLCSGDTINKDAEYIGLDISHPLPYRFVSGCEGRRGDAHAWNGVQYYREYGDWDFGGNDSTSRKGREDGDIAMLMACWNQWHIYAHIFNKPEIIGIANWVGIDYNRGYCPEFPICRCGALDSLRRKKFLFEMMRSQGSSEPMVFIANHWLSEQTARKIVVFSNCDTVALYINGKLFAKNTPACGPLAEYKVHKLDGDPYYWMDGTEVRELEKCAADVDPIAAYQDNLMWNGDDAMGTMHPYFVFDAVPYERGCVEAIGYIDGNEAARHAVHSFGTPGQIRIVPDDRYAPLKADNNDFIFVDADILDDAGHPVYTYDAPVSFIADGGTIIGPDTVDAIAGKATVLLRAAGDVTVTVKSGTIAATLFIHTC